VSLHTYWVTGDIKCNYSSTKVFFDLFILEMYNQINHNPASSIISKTIFIILFLAGNEFAQSSEIQSQKRIIQYFNSNKFKECIDSGVKYLELYGSNPLKNYLSKVKEGFSNYDPNNLEQISKYIDKVIDLSPKIIPLYAIYAGIGEVSFWMMYKDNLPAKEKKKILNFSTSYFYNALDYVAKDSFKARSIVYQKMANIIRHYGDKGAADAADLIAFKYDPDNIDIGLKIASYYEIIGNSDSTQSILIRLYNSLKNKNVYQGIFDFLGDHFSNSNTKITNYFKALSQGAIDPSVLYSKIADEYFPYKPDSAIDNYKKAIKLGLSNDKILVRLGLLYNLKMDCKTAIEYFNKVKSWNNEPTIYADSYAGCYADIGDYNKAIKLYTISKNHSQIAYSYFNLKYYRQAIDVYLLDINNAKTKKWTNAIDKKNYLSWHYYNLAETYAATDERTEAFNAFVNANNYMNKNDALAMDLKNDIEFYRILKDNVDWDYLSEDDEFLYLYKKNEISKHGKLIQAWIKKVIFPYQKNLPTIKIAIKNDHPNDMKKYDDYYYTLTLYEFDTSKQKARCLRSSDYTYNGICLKSINFSNPEWSVTFPKGLSEYWVSSLYSM
jgi:hypothetical protein